MLRSFAATHTIWTWTECDWLWKWLRTYEKLKRDFKLETVTLMCLLQCVLCATKHAESKWKFSYSTRTDIHTGEKCDLHFSTFGLGKFSFKRIPTTHTYSVEIKFLLIWQIVTSFYPGIPVVVRARMQYLHLYIVPYLLCGGNGVGDNAHAHSECVSQDYQMTQNIKINKTSSAGCRWVREMSFGIVFPQENVNMFCLP